MVIAFTRAPTEGEVKSDSGKIYDDIIVFEIMTEKIDRPWWKQYRERLESLFKQDEIVIRSTTFEKP